MQPTKPVCLILFIVCIISFSSKAQLQKGEVFLSAEYNYYSDKFYYFIPNKYGPKVYVNRAGAKVGFMLTDVWALSVGFDYSVTTRSIIENRLYAVSLVGRYTNKLYKRWYVHCNVLFKVGAQVFDGTDQIAVPSNRRFYSGEANVGISYFFHENACLDIKLVSLGYEQYQSSLVYTNVNPQFYPVGLGLSLFL